MVFIGPISSIFDFLTFYVLLHFFRATRGAVSYRLVRRVAGYPDAGRFRHPHFEESAAQPPQQSLDRNLPCWSWPSGCTCRSARWRACSASLPCRLLLCVCGCRDRSLSAAGGGCQAPPLPLEHRRAQHGSVVRAWGCTGSLAGFSAPLRKVVRLRRNHSGRMYCLRSYGT